MTPLEEYPALTKALGLPNILLKREDLHPYGSHKGRSISVMIDHYYDKGDRRFVISSSGNAALAAILKILELNKTKTEPAELRVFYGPNISTAKLAILKAKIPESGQISLFGKERPLQAVLEATEAGYRSLRQSTDDIALLGYRSLAEELDTIEDLGAVFIGTSSGTTAQALAEYFREKKRPVEIHIIQTSSCHPISDSFQDYSGPEERSLADAIVDRTARRREKLVPLIRNSGGFGWVATNESIETAVQIVKKETDLDISTNSALSVVGAMEAVYRNLEIKGKIVCLICGR